MFMLPKLTMKTFLKILFAPLLWLFNACSPLGEPVDVEKSNNHYYNKKKTAVSYSSGGNWFAIGNSPMNVDVESFEVIDGSFGKDKNRAYYMSNPIVYKGLDLDKLYVKEGYYMYNTAFDDNNVYTFIDFYGGEEQIAKVTVVANANPKTFIRLSYAFSKDDSHWFYRDQVIPVDYGSFENINLTFSKDNERVYMHNIKKFKPIEADVRSFKILDAGNFAMDNLHVFSMSYEIDNDEATKLVSIPRKADEKVSLLNEVFLKIGDRIYHRGSYLPDLNPSEVEIIFFDYIKDKNHVYYQGTKLTDADAKTFEMKGQRKVGDKNGLFDGSKRIK